MPITVTPSTFNYVFFDAEVIHRIADELASSLGLSDQPIIIEVDETTPFDAHIFVLLFGTASVMLS